MKKIFCLDRYKNPASNISKKLDAELNILNLKNYHSLEKQVFGYKNTPHSHKHEEIFVYHEFKLNINDSLLELLCILDLLGKNLKITLILPFLPYLRQDKSFEDIDSSLNNKMFSNSSVGSRMISNLFSIYNISKIYTFDAHSPRSLSYFKQEVLNLEPTESYYHKLLEIEKKENIKITDGNCEVIAPDYGSINRAKSLAQKIKSNLIIYKKTRNGEAIEMNIENYETLDRNASISSCKKAIIVDDIIDTGSTILCAIKNLKNYDIIILVATHILSWRFLNKLPKNKHIMIIFCNSLQEYKKLTNDQYNQNKIKKNLSIYKIDIDEVMCL